MSIFPTDLKPPSRSAPEEWVADADRAFDAIPRVPLLDDDDCWRRMPSAIAGGQVPLPNWARALASHMPRTTAAMLVLDHAQRTHAPLDSVLRAKFRWVVACTNRSIYGMAYAAADLGDAGASEADLATLADPEHAWDADREALAFARQLTENPSSISDRQFASLVEQYGERSVAAMVLVGAYGSFQDRLVTALNLPVEKEGPLPSLSVRFAESAFSLAAEPESIRLSQPTTTASGVPAIPIDPRWRDLDYESLQGRLAQQRMIRPRLPIPAWEEIKTCLPPEYPTAEPVFIRWALVAMGYAPELALPWNMAARMFLAESQQDPACEASLLWIQSRVLLCSYGMGHAEMLLELAGLDEDQVAERTRALASGDWSCFPIDEQLAYAFDCLLTSVPWDVSDGDVACVLRELGQRRAVHMIWWLCRGLYLCRIADAIQLPLERDNVLKPRARHRPPAAAALAEKRTRAWKTA